MVGRCSRDHVYWLRQPLKLTHLVNKKQQKRILVVPKVLTNIISFFIGYLILNYTLNAFRDELNQKATKLRH